MNRYRGSAPLGVGTLLRGSAAGGLLALCAGAIGAQTAPARLSDLNLEQLRDVEIVSVSRRSERSSEAAAALSISQDDLRCVNLTVQVHHVARLLAQSVPACTALDARLGWELSRGFELALVGQNLPRSHHLKFGGAAAGVTEVPRSLYLKVPRQW